MVDSHGPVGTFARLLSRHADGGHFAIYTAAANTVQAELTNAALLTPSATATLPATETPTPTLNISPTPQFSLTPAITATTGQLMDKAEFIQQSVADNTNFTAGTTFRVVWTLRILVQQNGLTSIPSVS